MGEPQLETDRDERLTFGDSTLRALGARNLLFSEANQAIYQLDDAAVPAWRSGQAPRADAGTNTAPADRARAAPLPERAVAGLARLMLEIAGVEIELCVSEALRLEVEAVLGGLKSETRSRDVQLCARLVADRVDLLLPQKCSCARDEFLPLLKAQILEIALQFGRYEVALHAAGAVWRDHLMLVVGSPGAGKSTLAFALARKGFEIVADDVVLLHDDAQASGLPFAFTLKSGSWPMIERTLPDLAAEPIYRRPDGQVVRYIPLESADPERPRPIGSVILLNWRAGQRALLDNLDPFIALEALVAEGATRDERLSTRGFEALVAALDGAQCYRLSYGDAAEAAAVLRGLEP